MINKKAKDIKVHRFASGLLKAGLDKQINSWLETRKSNITIIDIKYTATETADLILIIYTEKD